MRLRQFWGHRSAFAQVCGLSFLFWGCGPHSEQNQIKEAWDDRNAPSRFGVTAERSFRSLPTSGEISRSSRPWSGYYWPKGKGGIAYRWQSSNGGDSYSDYLYEPLTSAEVSGLSAEELNRLSPAEKYDLYMGRLSFPLVRREHAATRKAVRGDHVPQWYGLCHGWAGASYSVREPGSVTVPISGGRSLTFYSSDLKALLAKVYGTFPRKTHRIGARCKENVITFDRNGRVIRRDCRDANPGSFHLVLLHYVSYLDEPFIADFDHGYQVWNYPIVSYTYSAGDVRRLMSADARYEDRAAETVYVVDIDMEVEYAGVVNPDRDQRGPARFKESFKYSLELDALKRIVGGEWHSKERPDFVWKIAKKPQGEHKDIDYAVVKDLIESSL